MMLTVAPVPDPPETATAVAVSYPVPPTIVPAPAITPVSGESILSEVVSLVVGSSRMIAAVREAASQL